MTFFAPMVGLAAAVEETLDAMNKQHRAFLILAAVFLAGGSVTAVLAGYLGLPKAVEANTEAIAGHAERIATLAATLREIRRDQLRQTCVTVARSRDDDPRACFLTLGEADAYLDRVIPLRAQPPQGAP